MKNTKAFKILTLALTLAVLAVGLCFIASAEEELSVSIIAKNVSYDDVVKVMNLLVESGEVDFEENRARLIDLKLGEEPSEEEVKKLLYKYGFIK